MKKLWLAVEVLRKGRRLARPEPWKNVTVLSGILLVVIPPALSLIAAVTGFEIKLNEGEMAVVANNLANVGVGAYGLFIVWTTLATSRKVGV